LAKDQPKVTPLRPADVAEGRPSIRMTNDRILVRRPGSEERKTKAGLLIPATTAAAEGKRTVWAEVVAVGPNIRNIEVGDYVLVSPEAGYEAQIRGEDYLLLREREVHAIASEQTDSGTGLYL
jgi:chaperonin GroES